jgi:hypothetical protein
LRLLAVRRPAASGIPAGLGHDIHRTVIAHNNATAITKQVIAHDNATALTK